MYERIQRWSSQKKKKKRNLKKVSLILLINLFSRASSLLNPFVSNIRKVYARKPDKETAISPPFAKSLFTLERARKYASRRNRWAILELVSGPPQDTRAIFGNVNVEHIRKKRTPTIRLEVAYAEISNFFCVYLL